MDKNYAKIEVLNEETKSTELWYLDLSKLGLTDLIKLRKEIMGENHHLETVLTDIIDRESGNTYETYKANRRISQKMKQPLKNRKRVLNKKRGRYN